MTLLVLVPFIAGGIKPGVLEALRPLPVGATLHPYELRDPEYGYGRVLRSLWEQCGPRRVDLCIIEQDNIVEPFRKTHDGETGTIADFIRCPDWWCAHSYAVASRPDVAGLRATTRDIATAYGGPYGLGCVRFRSQLLLAEPDAAAIAIERPESDKPPGHYLALDSAMTGLLRGRIDRRFASFEDGFTRLPRYDAHQHFPNVGHAHAYDEPVGTAAPA